MKAVNLTLWKTELDLLRV